MVFLPLPSPVGAVLLGLIALVMGFAFRIAALLVGFTVSRTSSDVSRSGFANRTLHGSKTLLCFGHFPYLLSASVDEADYDHKCHEHIERKNAEIAFLVFLAVGFEMGQDFHFQSLGHH